MSEGSRSKTRRPGRPGDRRNDNRRQPREHRGRAAARPNGDRQRSRDRHRPPVAAALTFHGELLFGRQAVRAALRGRRQLRRLFVAEGVREDERVQALLHEAETRGLMIDRVPRLLLDDATGHANHQGIALEASAFPYTEFGEIIADAGTVLVLDHLQDPQNLGTLLRSAEATGVTGVVIPHQRAVGVTPAVVNASAGAVEHLRVATVPNIVRALDQLKESGWWVVGLDQGEDAADLFTTDIPTPAVIVIGAEGGGIAPHVRRQCDLIVALPMRGTIPSLNAATAGSVALFDLLRRANLPEP